MIKKIFLNKKINGYLLAFITLFFWSIDTVIIRYLVFDVWISANFIWFSRFFLWWIFLLFIWIIFFKKDFSKLIYEEKIYKNKLFLYSSFFLFLNFVFFHIWLKYTLASDSVILETFSPVFALLILLMLFPKRAGKLSNMKKLFFTILFGSIWSSFIVYNSPEIPWVEYSEKFFWDILQVIWMFCFAFFMVYNSELKKTTSHSWILLTGFWLIFWAVLMFPLALFWIETINLIWIKELFLLLFIWIWATWIAYFSWFLASKYLNTITLALLFNIISITTIITESIVYKDIDIISWKLILWWLFIIISAIYVEFLNKKN